MNFRYPVIYTLPLLYLYMLREIFNSGDILSLYLLSDLPVVRTIKTLTLMKAVSPVTARNGSLPPHPPTWTAIISACGCD
jgi:hypothetical protein